MKKIYRLSFSTFTSVILLCSFILINKINCGAGQSTSSGGTYQGGGGDFGGGGATGSF